MESPRFSLWPGWVQASLAALGGGDGQLQGPPVAEWWGSVRTFRSAPNPKGLICPVTPTPVPGGGLAGEKPYLLL